MIQKIALIMQILCYFTAVMLVFAKPAHLFQAILQFSFMIASIAIKVIREGVKKNLKLILKNQITFYLAYLLIAFEIYFLYQAMIQIFDRVTIVWTILVIIVKGISLSLLMNKNTANNLQLAAYSIGQIVHVVMAVKSNVQAVYLFDQIGGYVDYIKDMVLLFIATVIAQGILVLDLLFRVYEKRQQTEVIKIQEEPIQVELLKV